MSDDGREVRHVFTFRHPPPRRELDDWLAEFAPEAEIRHGGGLQVLIGSWQAAFYFALVWRGRYDASYHPDDRAPPLLPPPSN